MHNCDSRRYFRIEKINIETDVQVSVGIHVLQCQVHGLAHTHFVNEAHIEHLELLFVHKAPLAGIDAAYTDLPDPFRGYRRRCAADLQQLAGTEST
jgi:hypothetical protein